MMNFSMSDTCALGSGPPVERDSSFRSSQRALPNIESLTKLGSRYSQQCFIRGNPMNEDCMEDGSPQLWTVFIQTQTQQQVAWGNMRNSDALSSLERSLWLLCGKRSSCFLGCTHLEWSFCLADLAGERRFWVIAQIPDYHCPYQILLDILE